MFTGQPAPIIARYLTRLTRHLATSNLTNILVTREPPYLDNIREQWKQEFQGSAEACHFHPTNKIKVNMINLLLLIGIVPVPHI